MASATASQRHPDMYKVMQTDRFRSCVTRLIKDGALVNLMHTLNSISIEIWELRKNYFIKKNFQKFEEQIFFRIVDYESKYFCFLSHLELKLVFWFD